MRKLIGVTSFLNVNGARVKRAAVLFDRIIGMSVDDRGAREPIEKLREYGVIGTTVDKVGLSFSNGIDMVLDLAQLKRWQAEPSTSSINSLDGFCDLITRILTGYEAAWKILEHDDDATVTPLFLSDVYNRTLDGGVSPVLRIVLQSLPLPDDDTPWDAIRDWRSDSDARQKYDLLRRWMSRVSRDQLSASDIGDELCGMLAEYNQYMALQHKYFSRGRLEIVATAAAEVLENAVRLRLSKAMETLFGLSRAELRLLDAELKAPGREVAFIAAARDRFGTSSSA